MPPLWSKLCSTAGPFRADAGAVESVGGWTDVEQKTEDGLERLSRRIGLIGGLIAALVGLNTLLTTCSREQAARYAEFRLAVAAEEAVWRALYDDYLSAFASNVDPESRRARLVAIQKLADREPPPFREFKLGLLRDDPDAKRLATERLWKMRTGLEAALGNPDSSVPQVVRAVEDSKKFREDEANKILPRSGEAAIAVQRSIVAEVTPAAPQVTTRTQVLAAGVANGWDIDLFWCSSDDATINQQNYNIAMSKGSLLARISSARNTIAPGVQLGRVRLRALPPSRQGLLPNGLLYPRLGDGLQLRYENQAPSERIELPAARAVATLVNQSPPGAALFASQTPTPFYLSLFVCAGPNRPITSPQPVTAAAAT